MERTKHIDIRYDAALKLRQIFRLPLQVLPHSSRRLVEGVSVGIQVLMIFQCFFQFCKNIMTSLNYTV